MTKTIVTISYYHRHIYVLFYVYCLCVTFEIAVIELAPDINNYRN